MVTIVQAVWEFLALFSPVSDMYYVIPSADDGWISGTINWAVNNSKDYKCIYMLSEDNFAIISKLHVQ